MGTASDDCHLQIIVHIRLAIHPHPSALTLDHSGVGSVGILGADTHHLELRIGQDHDPRSIDPVIANIRIIHHILRCAEQAGRQIDVVEVHVIERTAGQLRVKGRRDLPVQIIRILARILGKCELRDPHRSEIPQFFLHEAEDFIVRVCDRFQHIAAGLLRDPGKLLCLLHR